MDAVGVREALTRLNWRDLAKRSDVLASLGLVSILMIMIITLPSIMLDLFISMNITLALLILVISL